MELKEYLMEYIYEFSEMAEEPLEIDNYIGLSVVTDGLKMGRDNILALIAAGPEDRTEPSFEVYLEGGDAAKTEPYTGITPGQYAMLKQPAEKGCAEFMEFIRDKYVLMHNGASFGRPFLARTLEINGIDSLQLSYIDTMLLFRALRSGYSIGPTKSMDELDLIRLNGLLGKYPAMMGSESLKRVHAAVAEEDSEDVYQSMNQATKNAFLVRDVYADLLSREVTL